MKELTSKASEVTQIPAEKFNILTNEMERDNIGVDGKLLSDMGSLNATIINRKKTFQRRYKSYDIEYLAYHKRSYVKYDVSSQADGCITINLINVMSLRIVLYGPECSEVSMMGLRDVFHQSPISELLTG